MTDFTIGIVGIKLGMSRVFREEGDSIPVTVIQARPNRVCQIKHENKDGYNAVQLAQGEQKPQRLSKALRGHYAKKRVALGRCLREFKIDGGRIKELSAGNELDVTQFVEGQRVDLVGISKGRGFSGGVRRWNFSMQDATHGNSVSHRHIGSTGQCQFPGKVWKGKKMPGQYGNKRITAMRLEVIAIDEENHLLLIKGAVPGAEGGQVLVRPSKKQTSQESTRTEERRQARAEEMKQKEDAQEEKPIEETPSEGTQTEGKTDQATELASDKEEETEDKEGQPIEPASDKEAKTDSQKDKEGQ